MFIKWALFFGLGSFCEINFAQNLYTYKNDLDQKGFLGRVKEVHTIYTCDSFQVPKELLGLTTVNHSECETEEILKFNERGNLTHSIVNDEKGSTIETWEYNISNEVTRSFITKNDSVVTEIRYERNEFDILLKEISSANGITTEVVYYHDKNWMLIQKEVYHNGKLFSSYFYKHNKARLQVSELYVPTGSGRSKKYKSKYNASDLPIRISSSTGTSYYEYDVKGRIFQITELRSPPVDYISMLVVRYYTHTRPASYNLFTTRHTDTEHKIIYAKDGYIYQEMIYPIGHSNLCEVINYEYDTHGNLVCLSSDHLYKPQAWLTLVDIQFEYDSRGNWIKMTIHSLGYKQTAIRKITYYE